MNMPVGKRIVVDFCPVLKVAIGEAQGLLAGFLGHLATDCALFPIGFVKWNKMPPSRFEDCWQTIVNARFLCKINEYDARKYIYKSIAKKWGAHRLKLWKDFYDGTQSRPVLIANFPPGIEPDQWVSYIDYRFKKETKELCARNTAIRQKQIIPHTGGAKPNARRMKEMRAKTGKRPGRAAMYLATHKKKDGSYVDEAKELRQQLEAAITESTVDESIISPNDAVGRILGKEHSGRVRCLGLGVVPTTSFKRPRVHNNPVNAADYDVNSHSQCDAKIKGLCDALKSYFITKEGKVPHEFAGIISNPTMPSDAHSGPSTPVDARRSSHGCSCAASTSANDEN